MLREALVHTRGASVLVGMGERSHGEVFAQKLRLDLEELPLVVSAPPFELYSELGLRDHASLLQLYARTVNVQTLRSALQGMRAEGWPTYDAGGSLTQLGGTFVIAPDSAAPEGVRVVYEHIDTMTGGHAPTEQVVAALEAVHEEAGREVLM